MNNELKKTLGLSAALSTVIGVVIGSGVFFKAQTILDKTDGNVMIGILAWVIGGINMLICALTFAILASRHGKINGLIDVIVDEVPTPLATLFNNFSQPS